MKNNTVRFIARTAVLVAVALVFQSLRYLFPDPSGIAITYLIGTLVNLTLCVACGVSGIWSGLVVAVIAPIVAFAQGHAQVPMLPGIILGNSALVLLCAPLFHKKNALGFVSAGAGVLAKYALIALNMTFMLMGLKGAGFVPAASTAFMQQIVQLITAAIGIAVALPVAQAVRRALKI